MRDSLFISHNFVVEDSILTQDSLYENTQSMKWKQCKKIHSTNSDRE